MCATMVSYDPVAPAVVHDRCPKYAALEHAPVYHIEATALSVVSQFDDAHRMREPRLLE